MTTMNTDNDHDSSAAGQTSSSPPQTENGHTEYANNGQTEQASSTSTGSKPEDERKLFVGGLTWDTTQDDLREYFSKFGTIVDCSIKHDPSTGRSRGFAFLVFDSKDIVEKILSQNEHFVKGRKVDPKPAHRRLNAINNLNNNHTNLLSQSSYAGYQPSSNNNNNSNNNRKVFIGGLDPNFSDAQLREYFSKFGKIDEIDLPYDKEKNERRPFCFISFQTEQAAQEVLRLQRHTIGDMSVDVKRAKPKTSNQQHQQQYQQHVYDSYGHQNVYANYANQVSTYNANVYPPADGYAHWNAYQYNQQANPAAYSYGGSSPGTSSYSQYSDHPSNCQYPYQGSNSASSNDYYSQYGYGAQQTAGVYVEGNVYGSGYDYGNYYPSTNTGMNSSIGENVNGQQSGNSPGNPADYDHENYYGKTKKSIVSSPTYHPYSRN